MASRQTPLLCADDRVPAPVLRGCTDVLMIDGSSASPKALYRLAKAHEGLGNLPAAVSALERYDTLLGRDAPSCSLLGARGPERAACQAPARRGRGALVAVRAHWRARVSIGQARRQLIARLLIALCLIA